MLKNGSNPQNKVESLPFSFKWSEGIAPSPNLMILRHPPFVLVLNLVSDRLHL